jgi:hypothetical protein
LTGLLRLVHLPLLFWSSEKPAAHAGATSRVRRPRARTSSTRPHTRTFYGRWLWRGGSTRSHPELGSENPLRGWYCRGHPVGEYGAAGLILRTPALILVIRAGVRRFCRFRARATERRFTRSRGREKRSRGGASAESFSRRWTLRRARTARAGAGEAPHGRASGRGGACGISSRGLLARGNACREIHYASRPWHQRISHVRTRDICIVTGVAEW